MIPQVHEVGWCKHLAEPNVGPWMVQGGTDLPHTSMVAATVMGAY